MTVELSYFKRLLARHKKRSQNLAMVRNSISIFLQSLVKNFISKLVI